MVECTQNLSKKTDLAFTQRKWLAVLGLNILKKFILLQKKWLIGYKKYGYKTRYHRRIQSQRPNCLGFAMKQFKNTAEESVFENIVYTGGTSK